MAETKRELEGALPFAMEPVVYDFRINPHGTQAELVQGFEATMPARYYALQVSQMIDEGCTQVASQRRIDLDQFANRSGHSDELVRVIRGLKPTYEKEPPRTAEEVIERAASSGV